MWQEIKQILTAATETCEFTMTGKQGKKTA